MEANRRRNAQGVCQGGTEETVITAKLDELQKKLAEKKREDSSLASRSSAAGEQRRKSQLETLKIQVALLEQLKSQLEVQGAETKRPLIAIKDDNQRSSRQSFWLTIGSSVASLVLGWLLSLLTSPVGVLRAFGR